MNRRQATRIAAALVAKAAYDMAKATGPANLPYGDADRERIENALLLIANRLDDRAEGRTRRPKPEPVDPNQVSLFE